MVNCVLYDGQDNFFSMRKDNHITWRVSEPKGTELPIFEKVPLLLFILGLRFEIGITLFLNALQLRILKI